MKDLPWTKAEERLLPWTRANERLLSGTRLMKDFWLRLGLMKDLPWTRANESFFELTIDYRSATDTYIVLLFVLSLLL